MTLNGKIPDTYLWNNPDYILMDYIKCNFDYFKFEDLLTHGNTKKVVFVKKTISQEAKIYSFEGLLYLLKV